MTITARAQRPGATVRALGAVTVGTLLANLLAYLVQVPASRVLGPDGFGEFSVLNAAMLVLSVPALAVQAVVAREVVTGTSRRRLWRLIGVVGVLVAIGSAVGVGVMMQIAHTSWSATVAALAGAAPLAVIAGGQGLLQGTGRFGLLGGVLAGVGVAKSVPIVAAVWAGAGPTGARAAGTVGTVVAAAVVAGVAGWRGGGIDTGRASSPVSMCDVLSASSVQFVMIVAVSVDLLLSRSVLSAGDAGVYALGAVATKAAFWLPQAIGVVVYPRLADPVRSGAALRRAAGVLAGIGCGVTVLAAVCGPLVPIAISDDYRPVAGLMWLFAATGSLLAVLQLMLLAAIARNRARGAVPAFAVLVVEVVLIFSVADSVVTLAALAAGAAVSSVIGTWAWVRMAG
ncbi:polysaccharide biosynthesis protein [Gordonia sp. MP11Mi]|uniref:Polysaccharide biosynthesis protein n=1 Tax=Gordonia sp. MP11Mi TaxID=3022769 RepID=A0AA97GVD0_9ACTN